MKSLSTVRLALIVVGILVATLPPTKAIPMADDSTPYYGSELIFQPTLRFPRCHSSTITELPDGTLIAAWWNGSEEGANDVVIRAARRPAGSSQWEPPQIVSDTPDTTEGNPVLFPAPNGEVWLFHRVGLNPWKRIVWLKSTDKGKTWQPQKALLDEPDWALRSRVVQLRNGHIVVPIMRHTSSVFLISSDLGKTWYRTAEIQTEPRNNEPTLIQRNDGSLLAFMRPYDRSAAQRFLWQTDSHDNGRTWSKAIRTDIRNPSSAVELLKLRSGHVALVFNDSHERRTPLNLALSLDDARTWSHMRVLEDGAGRFEYPTMTQSADGRIHLSYTFRRLSIKHVEVNEAWIRERSWDRRAN